MSIAKLACKPLEWQFKMQIYFYMALICWKAGISVKSHIIASSAVIPIAIVRQYILNLVVQLLPPNEQLLHGPPVIQNGFAMLRLDLLCFEVGNVQACDLVVIGLKSLL